MPTWNWDMSWAWVFWNMGAFAITVVWCSFAEHILHSRIMHKKFPLIPYGYDHVTSHHTKFDGGEGYHAKEEWLKKHVLFTWKEYTLIPVVCGSIFATAEILAGRPIMAGCFAALLLYLNAFNIFHWFWHVPSNTWFERTAWFRWMAERHRIHHEDQGKNFNLIVPLADLAFGTFVGSREQKRAS